VQEHGRGERHGQQRDLPAEGADQDRGPQPAVGPVAKEIVGRERAIDEAGERRLQLTLPLPPVTAARIAGGSGQER
jgi:hypothetical protein